MEMAISETVTGQLVDSPTRGLPTCGVDKSQTGQLADATGDFECLVFIFWPFINVFAVYLSIHFSRDAVNCICPHSLAMQLKQQVLTACGICKLSSYQ